ncbi:hypothetical protein [Longirhabdus pacifica]|uniref:hypothetical protein n=1 Tax=Longirhabdus pacifica TaxID=2305227 RepID=UPI001008711C|nr:hypothetical protein [Longirhabdus pacifica]
MIFIGLGDAINAKKVNVELVHYQPYDKEHGLSNEQLSAGVMVNAVPESDHEEIEKGNHAKMYYNPQAKQLFYEYVPVKHQQKA